MQKQKLIVIGNGMAGLRCIENILKEDNSIYDITIFGSEPHVNYSRIMLSSVLQGGTTFDDITINHLEWYQANNIRLYTGETVIEIDKNKKLIKTDKEREVPYDKLILATGSHPFMLPLPGAEKEGIVSFRTIEDCQRMMETAKHYKKAVVIGGGLLGLEAARGLLNLGMKVDVVHNSDRLMNKQLDQTAAHMLQEELEAQGMNFLLEKDTERIVGNTRVEGLQFNDGTHTKADLVVMAVGVRPNITLAKQAGIETNRGILVDDYLQTQAQNIYAVGECAEHNGIVYGLVKPLYQQGAVLARHLCKKNTKGYQGSILSTQLKISGVDVFSVGQLTTDETTKSIYFHDEIASTYKKVFFRDDKAVGAVLFGDTKEGPRLLDIIMKQKFVPDQEKADLLRPTDPADSYVATLPKKEFICTCNSVSKGAIIDNVLAHNLSSVNDVKACTKASSSCGGCKPAVRELLDYISSDHFNETTENKSFCSCTTLTEDEIVTEIQTRNLASVHEITEALGWINKEGCTTCRPALEYYLGMIYPEYEQNQETLYLNDKMNAIVRNDGTYSIVPQLYGGIVQTNQLRKIADVADKYGLPTLAITSDQRIHLKGIRQEDLSSVWSDLNMRLHSTTANTVQSIKTSNGDYLCECNKELASQMAYDLEKRTEFLKTPYRIRMGVSACMHNGAGSTTKDIGLMKVNRGWEIYVGGSSGRNARSGELLTVATTKEEAIQLSIGFIQYYRQSANYLERTWQWMERVSLVHIREVLFDQDLLQFLIEKLKTDQAQRKRLLVRK
ncbi:nitrite reductase large subunit NirB [Aquibacillus sediminis]|uniref:nitrite reductase large subunit NirB n=1 Tax=Aquibacillus sediminis TaxID=2574734 RepID=UPI001107B048|nr:nitrite reductase large subunit NirB [Aquibacillus sediminis]